MIYKIFDNFGKIFRCTGVYIYIIFVMITANLFFHFNDFINYKKSLKDRININRTFYIEMASLFFNALFWIKIEIENEDKLSFLDFKKNNYIILSNHISYLDNFIITNVLKKIKNYQNCEFIGDSTILNWFIVGKVFKGLGMIEIKFEKDNKKERLEQNKYCKESVNKLKEDCIKALKEGKNLWFFPEGRCNNHPNKLNQIRGGAFNFQQTTKVPILLVALKNNEKVWANKGYPTGSSKIQVKFFDNPRIYNTVELYRNDIKNSIETWINN
ncbi:Acyltransferase [seawater metagenome]|uniref:Acyltransferase n=1 Tax=seawater metagenome TaxID=1561972 RepID=A0A5E8CJW5_9ZZZZ